MPNSGRRGLALEQERRRPSRASYEGWVEIVADGRRRLASGCDLSAGGIGMRLNHDPPSSGTAVTSEFALPGISLPLALEGRVAWVDLASGRLGVRFEPLDASLAELLDSYVAGGL